MSVAVVQCSIMMGDNIFKTVRGLVEQRFHEQLVDFDNHLDDVRLDWTNPDINRALAD